MAEELEELEQRNGLVRCTNCYAEVMRNSLAGLILDLAVLIPLTILAIQKDSLPHWTLLGVAALLLSFYHKQLLWLFPLMVVESQP